MRRLLIVLILPLAMCLKAQEGFFVDDQTPFLTSYDRIEPTAICQLENGNYFVAYWNKVSLSARVPLYIEYDSVGNFIRTRYFPYGAVEVLTNSMVENSKGKIMMGTFAFLWKTPTTVTTTRYISTLLDTAFDTVWTTINDDYDWYAYDQPIRLTDSTFLGIKYIEPNGGIPYVQKVEIVKFNSDKSIIWETTYDSIVQMLPFHKPKSYVERIWDITYYRDSIYGLVSSEFHDSCYVFSLSLSSGEIGRYFEAPQGTFKIDASSGQLLCFHREFPVDFSEYNISGADVSIYDLNFQLLSTVNPEIHLDTATEHLFTLNSVVDTINDEICFLYGIDDLSGAIYDEKWFTNVGVLRVDEQNNLIQKVKMNRNLFEVMPVHMIMSKDNCVVFNTVSTNFGRNSFFVKVCRDQKFIGLPEGDNYQINGLGVYPNPASTAISISFPADFDVNKAFEVKIYALDGQLVETRTLNNSASGNLKIEHLAKGVYVLYLNQSGKSWQEKFVVE